MVEKDLVVVCGYGEIRGCLVSCFRGCLFGFVAAEEKDTTTVVGGGGLGCVLIWFVIGLIVVRFRGVWICVCCCWFGFGSD